MTIGVASDMARIGVHLFLLVAAIGASAQVTNMTTEERAAFQECLTCLCEAATECDLRTPCRDNLCGPLAISRFFWIDGGSLGDGWEKCSVNLGCATRTVEGYIDRYWKDCDGDSKIDCEDFARMHNMGGVGCTGEPTAGFVNFKRSLDACLEEVRAADNDGPHTDSAIELS